MLDRFVCGDEIVEYPLQHLLEPIGTAQLGCVAGAVLEPVGEEDSTCLDVVDEHRLQSGVELVRLEVECDATPAPQRSRRTTRAQQGRQAHPWTPG